MEPKLCLVAKGISIDQTTSETSAWGIVQRIETQAYPLFIQELAFFSVQERSPDEPAVHECIFTITLDGETLVQKATRLNFRDNTLNRNTMRISGMIIPRPGSLKFSLTAGGEEFCAYTVEARQTAPAEVTEDDDHAEG